MNKCYEMYFYINVEKFRNLCVRKGWYGYSTTKEYNAILDRMAGKIANFGEMVSIASDIQKHSDQSKSDEIKWILYDLFNNCVITKFDEVPIPERKKPETFWGNCGSGFNSGNNPPLGRRVKGGTTRA